MNDMPPKLPRLPPGFITWALLGCAANAASIGINFYLALGNLSKDWLLALNCLGLGASLYALLLMPRNAREWLASWRDLQRAHDELERFIRDREQRK
jgi:hypothetical protein